MNELNENPQNIISSDSIMPIKSHIRKKIRTHFGKTPKQIREYMKDNELGNIDEAYQSLKIIMDAANPQLTQEQLTAKKKEDNRLRNIRYRERKRAKAQLEKLVFGGINKFSINLSKSKGLNNDFKSPN